MFEFKWAGHICLYVEFSVSDENGAAGDNNEEKIFTTIRKNWKGYVYCGP